MREKMVSAIPELANHKLGFDWFGAFDYFTCRRGHGIEIAEEVSIFDDGDNSMIKIVNRIAAESIRGSGAETRVGSLSDL